MPQWDYPYDPPYSIYRCERPWDQAQGLIKCRLRQPLESPDHIRLLKVYPPGWPNRLAEKLSRDEDTRIQCDIFQVALASMTTKKRPYFATLSYAWGDPGVTRDIHCGKESVSVTRNLYEALIHIRNLRTPRLLWVDSLCINQVDEQEKGQQVQRMHLIYGQSHCFSWMGVETEGGFDLRSMLPIIKWLYETEVHLTAQNLTLTWDNLDDHILQNSAGKISSLRQVPWTKLLHCLDRDIFSRLWCVQEILLARSNDIRTSKSRIDIAVLACSTSLVGHALQDVMVTTSTPGDLRRETGTPLRDIQRLTAVSARISSMLMTAPLPCLNFKGKAQPIIPVTALSIIDTHAGRECRDPRDHIYGLAALCNLGTSYNISYSTLSLTTPEVFADFTLHSLRTMKSLEALALINRRAVFRETSETLIATSYQHQHRTWTPGLPTWCPDFAGPIPFVRRITSWDHWRKIPLRSSKGYPAVLTSLSRQQLGITGIEVGTIQVCGNVWSGSANSTTLPEWSRKTWQYLASLQRCMDSIKSSIPAQSLCRRLLDVLSVGRDWRRCSAWEDLTLELPAQTSNRMIQSSLGAAWIVYHLPGLASNARLTLHRWLGPYAWRRVAGEVNAWIFPANGGTRFFTTDNDNAIIGTGPEGLRVGDIVCVLYGGDVPFILHPDGQGRYTLIGECYVNGIMQGEALDMGLEEREFLIV